MSNLETQNLIPPPATTHHHPPPPPEPAKKQSNSITSLILQPFQWLNMLSTELNPSFILGIFLIYGLSQGFSGSFFKVVTDYYWKDVQKIQPSKVQVFIGLYHIPWVMKPIWGLMTDVFPVMGYRRRPYFILAGVVGMVAATTVAEGGVRLGVAAALWCLIAVAAGMAMADVTIDACIARNSIEMKELAPDMQSLCGVCSSAGALVGYATSGFFVHHLGPQIALGILAVPAASQIFLGFVIYEKKTSDDLSTKKRQAIANLGGALKGMYETIQFPEVWKPSLYMYLSIALSFSTHEGQFYWYTDPKAGPAFSQVPLFSYYLRRSGTYKGGACIYPNENDQLRFSMQELVGMVHAIGALASIVGVLIYHKLLKDYPFRKLLFYAQLVYGLSGFLDLMFILRWNLVLGLPDYMFVVMEECVSRVVSRVRWMPMIVLSTSLCPIGIEGTFFALLMSIDSFGSLSSKWGGAVILHVFHVMRTDFRNLWLVILIRNLLRLATLGFIFLVPNTTRFDIQNPSDILQSGSKSTDLETNSDSLQLVPLKEQEV
ncbi:putative MFS transporter superfamily, biopterin transporter family [Helianthus annuus]|nr:putative MFS transporter superfamily, biopterin transporter family [Helianthus annuus]KAJ0635080.1 putative MFS transporter superfamily, biopterin transporter family [Helianthus annuus]